jgi:hypothetical protein
MDVKNLIKKPENKAPKTVDRSVCTIISGLPFRLREEKPGLFPIGMFMIPPVKKIGDINTLIVREGFYFRYVGDGKSIEQYEKAESIARSIVNDYSNSQLGIDISDEDISRHARPAIFYVYGELTNEDALYECAAEIELAIQQQMRWFERLVQLADDDWQKTHMHKGISDLQRYAAKALDVRRDWSGMITEQPKQENCPACGTMVNAGVLVCSACRTIIRPKEFKEAGFATVGA